MKKLLSLMAAAAGIVSGAFAATLDLSTVGANTTVANGTILTGTLGGNYKISVADGAKVWFNNVTISGSDDELYAWAGVTCLGDATIVLEGSNDVCGFAWCYPGIHVPADKTLTIEGNGSLSASSHGYAAGIGGGEELPCGNIVIDGGTITATGAGAPGIGGGYQVSCGNIVINGGTVVSIGGDSSAGIGSAYMGSCGSISINGGTVTASGKYGSAGIGGAYEGSCGSVSVGAGVTRVVASCGSGCDNPMGAGLSGSCGTVTVDGSLRDSIVEASGVLTRTIKPGVNLAALAGDLVLEDGDFVTGTLGGNYKISVADGAKVWFNNVTISGSDDELYAWAGVTCLGDATIVLEGSNDVCGFAWCYPGIHVPADKTLTIEGNGSLSASSHGYAAGIGGGEELPCGNIVIDGGTITATGAGAPGIGGGYQVSCGNIVINGGTVVSIGGDSSAGIGSAYMGSCGSISINGGTVTASGKYGSAGIGGAYEGSCGSVSIGAGVTRVVASCGLECDDPIGAGLFGTCGAVTVDSGMADVVTETSSALTRTIKPGVNLAALAGDIVLADGDVATGTLGGNYKISVADGATVTLRDVTINGVNDEGYKWAGITCLGDATIVLEGENTVSGFFDDYPGIYVPANKTLTVRGSGSLDARGQNSFAPGIGGGTEIDCGNIVIAGGSITAVGIGGGARAACGNITISGGTVVSTGASYAAGIGSGNSGSCGAISVMGGTVTATGGYHGAGIGSGDSGACGIIVIGVGIDEVVAVAGQNCETPIGAGYGGTCNGGVGVAEGLLDDTDSATHTRTITRGVRWNGDLSTLISDEVARDGLVIYGTLDACHQVTIADGATVTISNAVVNGYDSPSFKYAGLTCAGNATIILKGDNSVRGFDSEYPGIYVPEGSRLTVLGVGSLTATSNGRAAGIGGGAYIACGSIEIWDGTINAAGGVSAAGIGGGQAAACGSISIRGGAITATGGSWAAGIGSGNGGSCGQITIARGVVSATGSGMSAGIGGGFGGSCGRILIGCNVTRVVATFGEDGENPIGAGSGTGASCVGVSVDPETMVDVTEGSTRTIVGNLGGLVSDATIEDGRTITGTLTGSYKVSIADGATVKLRDANINTNGTSTGSTKWAGLTCEGDATIVLEGESVVKAFNSEYPGIYVPKGYALTIKGDGALEVRGGSYGAAGIGGGNGGTCGDIVIDADEGCCISATGGGFGAGIGSGLSSDCGNITIKGGTVDAVGGGGAAGIGSGNGGTCGDITIDGGVIDSIGGSSGPGIGSGNAGSCDDIKINGGTVTATGGDYAAGIGAGDGNYNLSECGYITINGGAVHATGGDSAAGIGTGREGYCWDVYIDSDIYCVEATCGADCVNPIGAGVGGNCEEVVIDTGLHDETSQDGKTRTLTPVDGFAAWAEEKGLTGEDAEWGAKPAMWGGLANAFVYTFGEGLADGTLAIMSISFDAAGKPVITTAPVVQDHTDFTVMVIGSSSLDDWTSPVELEKSGNDWTLPSGQTANFFRVRLTCE